jgi:hypothetical protein
MMTERNELSNGIVSQLREKEISYILRCQQSEYKRMYGTCKQLTQGQFGRVYEFHAFVCVCVCVYLRVKKKNKKRGKERNVF